MHSLDYDNYASALPNKVHTILNDKTTAKTKDRVDSAFLVTTRSDPLYKGQRHALLNQLAGARGRHCGSCSR